MVFLLSPREFLVNISEEVQRKEQVDLASHLEQAAVFLTDGAAPEHCKLKSQSHVLTPVSG